MVYLLFVSHTSKPIMKQKKRADDYLSVYIELKLVLYLVR